MGKIYNTGDIITVRLSKKAVDKRLLEVINKASIEGNLNQYIIDAIKFYAKYEEKKLEYIFDKVENDDKVDKILHKEKQIKATPMVKEVTKKEETPIPKNTITAVVENTVDESLSEVFETAKPKGLSGAFASLRRI